MFASLINILVSVVISLTPVQENWVPAGTSFDNKTTVYVNINSFKIAHLQQYNDAMLVADVMFIKQPNEKHQIKIGILANTCLAGSGQIALIENDLSGYQMIDWNSRNNRLIDIAGAFICSYSFEERNNKNNKNNSLNKYI